MESVSERKDIVRVPRILLHPSVISIQSGDIIAGVGWCRWMPMDEQCPRRMNAAISGGT